MKINNETHDTTHETENKINAKHVSPFESLQDDF